ncbi:MAG: hypothetical protein HY748_15840, partial [Elusimicrobia bacterium]|nr:hypothetical protein [Elusimicrobiota bacterium]
QYMRGTQYGDREWGNPKEIARRDAAYRDYVLTHYVVLPKEELDAGLSRSDELYADKLCQPWVIKMIGTIPGPTDAEWVVNKIAHERGKPDAIGRFIGAIARAVADGTAAIVKTVAAPFIGERRPQGGGSSPGMERPGYPPGGRIPDETSGKPYQQLRGIASETGSWD